MWVRVPLFPLTTWMVMSATKGEKAMPLFDVPARLTKAQDKKIASKSKSKKVVATTTKSGGNLLSRINQIKATVEQNLGQYKDEYQLIREEEVLHDFITECIGNGYISIDTETDGLDPIQNHIAGICPFTPGQKSAYIPLNHISYITNEPVPNQLSVDFVSEEFNRLLKKHPDIDMFNAGFDIRVLRNQTGIKDIYCTWDGYLAARVLNENELENKLKPLHRKYVLRGKGDAFTFDELFKGVPFTLIPPTVGYLYAAHDPVITYEYCEYQRQHLREDHEREDMRQLYWLFKNIEMPCVQVVADMEDIGVAFDKKYAEKLSEKYHTLLKEKEEKFYRTCDDFGEDLDNYRAKMGINNKLEYPINISSPQQIAIMLYDVLGIKPVDDKKPRGTGEDILQKIDHPVAKAILEYREINKLLSTYIDKLPECVNPKDGRIHCRFNQYGADTGRFSSQDPNLQNIPSHNKDIRKMFVATNGQSILSTENDQFEVSRWDEVETLKGFIPADRLEVGDKLKDPDSKKSLEIKKIDVDAGVIRIEVK